MMKLIFNSDDFGYSETINQATLKAFRDDFISSSSLLINMDSTDDAIRIIKKNDLQGKIGCHLNLQEGVPLTTDILNYKCCSDNCYNLRFRSYGTFFRHKSELKAIKCELGAQINLFKEKLGFLPSHLDSHNHTHTEYSIIKVIAELMNDFGISYLRPTRNIGIIPLHKNIYKIFYRKIAKIYGIQFVEYFGSIVDFNYAYKYLNQKSVEIECHMMFDEFNNLTDSGIPIDNEIFSKISKIKKISYCEIM